MLNKNSLLKNDKSMTSMSAIIHLADPKPVLFKFYQMLELKV